MSARILYIITGCLLIALSGCKEPYLPPQIIQTSSYLVVDGFINSGGDSTIIKLSRTRNLSDTAKTINEEYAVVTIESEAGNQMRLTYTGNGNYTAPFLPIQASQKYRLQIQTLSGETYQSDFVPVKQTPAIDSLSWHQDGGVSVSVNTHDPSSNTRYYRWEYTETYEYTPHFSTDLGYDYVNDKVYTRDSNNQISRCWMTIPSPDILLATTSQLSEDLIANFPIAQIPQNSEKLEIRYSILAKQYALTKEAFEYWQQVRKNSRELGSIFGNQPQQLNSNIHCTSEPGKPVIGFVSISSVSEKRIFIKNNEVSNWHPSSSMDTYCEEHVIIPADLRFFFNSDTSYVPAYYITVLPPVANPPLAVAKRICVDCTVRGGIPKKPSYW